MLIGILQTGDAPDVIQPASGNYPDMFERLLAGRGFDFRTWRVLDMQFPTSPHDADGWIITGSRFGVYEEHPFIPPLETFIRAVKEAHVPMVGICFGHQIIAQALGGRVEKFSGGWSVGPQDYDFGDRTVTLNAWHQDQVVERPVGAQVVASSGFCDNAALAYGDDILTVQAHPEFDGTVTQGLIDHRSGSVPGDRVAAALSRLADSADTKRGSALLADRIADFLTQRAHV
ncbi:glutamine amidotransferase [Haematobacter massiliensis]|uniref:Glutamine amidotransferase n=1 Tax=Haematobacter massiliensis TaxID=195105 RepID=A0A086YCT7_9RHOB|nr:type 1 glutamine amidotransferase [Haematobacter massiliensis]KFI32087.1 glutamine amidotransferase [Haematobacter massiliensis]OWJ72692.1 glutamine amidotransferase [Haematobacter massiliensis]OWJ81455.1 glutamine amidotransferase [Haematobacter massiliensis]QBJ24474.1 type 1 glutamine amidotransferase [Haematobacter massiliensis]